MTKVTLETNDMQGLLARGYGSLRFASFLLLGVTDRPSAGTTLAGWAGRLTSAAQRPNEVAINLALTADGIDTLAPDVAQRAAFSEQFTTGMTTDYRSRLLGDTGDDDPRGWTWGGPTSAAVHVLLLVYADTADRLAARCDELAAEAESGGLRVLHRLVTSELTPKENFGFHDGVSQPQIEGLGARRKPGEVKAGEFVLGYANEYGLLTDRPMLEPSADPTGLLPRAAGLADLGRNGSYLVLRTLRQEVEAFHAFTDTATRDAAGRPDPAQAALLAAMIVGRWPSGAPLVQAPAQDDPSLADSNDFGYHAIDARGLACPLGAHVRRTNPRDSLEPRPGTEASMEINRRHRLLRRGRSYGSPTSGEECGVHFICLSANLARQYEFVQHTWVNNPVFNGLEDETDPLVGRRSSKRSYFTAPARPVRRRYTELPQFVHVRGGAYFFLPGIRALRFLAATSQASASA